MSTPSPVLDARLADANPPDPRLAASITREASSQTYYTIQFLVDRGLTLNAYRTYGYFRWLDDQLDQGNWGRDERVAFVARQKALIERCYRNERPGGRLLDEERMVVELIDSDRRRDSGLYAYIRNMMAVMAFDAGRRGQLITQEQLSAYTRWLAVGVTEALHYFIGHTAYSPHNKLRYLAVTAAHITHMLRDTLDDVKAGYFNIPREVVELHGIDPGDVSSEAYRQWTQSRVRLARSTFQAGKDYFNQVESARCRIAGCAYTARFETVLDTIEQDDYRLRAGYPEGIDLGAGVEIARALAGLAVDPRHADKRPRPSHPDSVLDSF
jgi:phytoene/squalene synthetase